MAENLNLQGSNGITFDINTKTDVLTIKLNASQLDIIIKGILDSTESALYNKILQLVGTGIANNSTIKNMRARIVDLENGVTSGSDFDDDFETSDTGVDHLATRHWVEDVVLNSNSGLIDYGTSAASTGTSGNTNARIYIKYE